MRPAVYSATSADDEVEGLGEHRAGVEPFPVFAKRAADGEFDLAVLQHFANLGAGPAPETQLDLRERAPHFTEGAGEEIEIERSRDGDRQGRYLALLHFCGERLGGERAVVALLE